MFVRRDTTLGQLSQLEWYEMFASSAGKEEEGTLRIAALDITDDAASVKVIASGLGTSLSVKKGSFFVQVKVDGFPAETEKTIEKTLALEALAKA